MAWRRTAFCMALALGIVGLTGTLRPAAAQFADVEDQTGAQDPDAPPMMALSPDELRAVVARVAFYPDDLLAIVLPAATQPLQVIAAAQFLEERNSSPSSKPDKTWDPSVLALLNYPEVIQLMSEDLDWTQRLGNAVMDQQKEVLSAIQAARSAAASSGYLQSNDQQTVVTEQDTIAIKPADPEAIYVPTYDPQPVIENTYANAPPPVYSTPYPYYYAPGATFVTGVLVGAAFSYAFDWDQGGIDIDCSARGSNIDGDALQNKFSGDRNPEAKGPNGMKWSPQKARKTSSAPRATAKQSVSGAATARKNSPPSTKPALQTKRDSQRGSQSLGTNRHQPQPKFRQPTKPKPSQPRSQQKYSQSKSSVFSTMPSRRQTQRDSNRGYDSIGGTPNRVNRRR